MRLRLLHPQGIEIRSSILCRELLNQAEQVLWKGAINTDGNMNSPATPLNMAPISGQMHPLRMFRKDSGSPS